MRGYGQHNPVIEYQREGGDMFDEMNQLIQEDSVRIMMRANFTTAAPPKRESQVKEMDEVREEGGGSAMQAEATRQAAARPIGQAGRLPQGQPSAQQKVRQPAKRDAKKVGRNDPCPCGSGKKYKHCHGRKG
ncbi:MAG TPA: hypothetical protein GX717_08980 [Clostridiaceae bacterium]|nr:hypothetical protein [Clostridiaceae bacterium]